MNVHDHWILRYANCWEDADLLIKYITDEPGKKLLSVASGGENSLSLLCTDPSELWVADINPLQLHVFELKKTGVELLERNKYLEFAGYRNCSPAQRLSTYELLKQNLTDDARNFWNKNPIM